MRRYYIASCNFTARFPALSRRILDYVTDRTGLVPVRCCTPDHRTEAFTAMMPEGPLRENWAALPQHAPLEEGDEVITPCHTCVAILEEAFPFVRQRSLWELIDEDAAFPFPDRSGLTVTVQDCWRARERREEQDAVRSLLTKMGIRFVEIPQNREKADFCGPSLYRPQPERNPRLAPRHFAREAAGLFKAHTPKEQERLMEVHCGRYETDTVVCYCRNCLEGVLMGGKEGLHIAELLFPEEGRAAL